MRALIVLLSLSLAGCAAQDRPSEAPSSLSLLSALGMAQALQHQADELEALHDLDAAIEHVERVLSIPFPMGSDREDVRLDAYGRMAELELERGDLAAARLAIEQGRAEASHDSYFHARLLLTLGRVQQAEAAALREAGDEAGARRVSLEAVTTLEDSIAMNQRVLATLSATQEESP